MSTSIWSVQLGTLELEGQFLCTVQICCCFVSCVHEGYIRVIRKVRKTQHQNPEFGFIRCEIQKNPAKQYISIQRGVKLRKPSFFGGKLSFTLSFVFPEHLHCGFIYFECSYLYNYYNYSLTLWIKWSVSAFHTEI